MPNDVFRNNPNTSTEDDNKRVRTDKVYFFEHQDNKPELEEVRQALYAVGNSLVSSSFVGFDSSRLSDAVESEASSETEYADGWIGMPRAMQVSLYQKNQDECEGGDYYRMHTDACNDPVWTMGLLGYLRSLYLRRRYVTCIVYLNPDWEPCDGGCLRLLLRQDNFDAQNEVQDDGMESNRNYVDVEPIAGRLVIFSSVHTMHAVLPTFSRRLACSMWMTLNHN